MVDENARVHEAAFVKVAHMQETIPYSCHCCRLCWFAKLERLEAAELKSENREVSIVCQLDNACSNLLEKNYTKNKNSSYKDILQMFIIERLSLTYKESTLRNRRILLEIVTDWTKRETKTKCGINPKHAKMPFFTRFNNLFMG